MRGDWASRAHTFSIHFPGLSFERHVRTFLPRFIPSIANSSLQFHCYMSWERDLLRVEIVFNIFPLQYMARIINSGKHVFDRYSVIFSVVVVWIYAHLLTVGGAYNNAAPKTQLSCRTDRSGLIDAAPWSVSLFFSLYQACHLHISPLQT